MSESKFLQNVLKDLNEPGTVKRTYGIGAPSAQSDPTLHPMPSAMPEVLLSPSGAPSTEISPSSAHKALSEDATPPIEQSKALVPTGKDSLAPLPPNPQSNPWEEMRKATVQQNEFSRYIEASERLNKHREKMEEAAALYELRASLSMLQILPPRRCLDVASDFPVGCLPDPAAAFVESGTSSNSALRTMRGAGLIGATAAAARGNWTVREASGHTHPLAEYVLIVGPSGVGKSTEARLLRQPFDEMRDEDLRRSDNSRHASEVAALRNAIKVAEAQAKKRAAKILAETGDMNAAIDATRGDYEQIEAFRKSLDQMQRTQGFLLDRVTMAQLPFELAARGGAAAIIDPEGAILGEVRPSNSAILLKAFDGEYYSSATRTSGRVDVDDPCLTLCQFVQPDKARQFFNNPKLIDHGLAARFLPVFVSDRFGINHSYLPPEPPEVSNWHRNLFRTLLAIPRIDEDGRIRPRGTLNLSGEAESVLAVFRERSLEAERDSRFDSCRAFVKRLPEHAIRIAGLLHLMAHPASPQDHAIDRRTMENAAALAEFFLQHALVAFDPSAHDAITYSEKIFNSMLRMHMSKPLVKFIQRDIHRAIGTGRHHPSQIRAGLEELQRRHVLRLYDAANNRTHCVVHPRAFDPY